MSHEADFSFLDRQDLLEIIFPIAYSPLYMLTGVFNPSLSKTATRFIEVEDGVRIGCGFWPTGKECPTILYFHGNGETAGIHDWIAPYYNQRKINLFVTDFRGYGSSGGKPTITNMFQDTHIILQGFKGVLKNEGYAEKYFVMGRSLGSLPALEVAFHHQDEFGGLIIESGTSSSFRPLWGYLGKTERDIIENSDFQNKVKIRSVNRPTLIIHGENDQIIPVQEGKELYENSAARDKRLLIIPGADHNDVMVVRQAEYFQAIEDLVTAYS
ncbi:alpha/beta hydrolase [Chloroflexota bacterium]